jgi:hypothetical protein
MALYMLGCGVWEEATGCGVPAVLEEMRGISGERTHMQQQLGLATALTVHEQCAFHAKVAALTV